LAHQGFNASHVQLGEQKSEGGILGFLAEIGAQLLVEHFPVASGNPLDANQRTHVAPDRQDRDQPHPPLRESNATGMRQSCRPLRKLIRSPAAARSARRNGKGAVRFPRTTDSLAVTSGLGLLGQTSNSPTFFLSKGIWKGNVIFPADGSIVLAF
jgi:hypothetical protein